MMPQSAVAPLPPAEPKGYCAPPALAELIRDLYLGEKCGVLNIGRSGVEKRLFIDRGMILAATSSLDDERLPAFLAQHALIPREEAEALKGLDDRQVAEALLKRGQITTAALTGAIHDLAEQIMTGVFRWDELEYAFHEQPLAPWPVTTNVMVSFELIIRALRSMAGFETVRDAVLRQERAVRLAEDLFLPFDQLALSPIEGYLVSRIDGRTRPRDILAQIPPSEEDAAGRFLFGLLILGLAQFSPPLGPAMLSCAQLLRGDEEKRKREELELEEVRAYYTLANRNDAAALLGVRAGASQAEIRTAYEEKKERYDLSRFLRRVQVEMKEELQIIEARLIEAYLALRSKTLAEWERGAGERGSTANIDTSARRKEVTKTEKQALEEHNQRLAGQYLTKARDFWKMGDIYNCIRYCEFAQGYYDLDAAIHSLLGQALARNPDHRWRRRAENALIRATELDAFNPAHWMSLGEFYRQIGLVSKARRQFEKVLQLQSSHAGAKQALKELPESKS
jgi:Domain of unknown function (DUF4388)